MMSQKSENYKNIDNSRTDLLSYIVCASKMRDSLENISACSDLVNIYTKVIYLSSKKYFRFGSHTILRGSFTYVAAKEDNMGKDQIGKVIITQDDYFKLLSTFDNLDTRTLDTTFVPTPEDIDSKILPYITSDKTKFCYLMWLDSEIKETPENKEAISYIRKVIKEHVVILNSDNGPNAGVN